MANLIAFVNAFLSYLILVGVFAVLAVAAVLIGIRLRKNKNLASGKEQDAAGGSV